SSAVMLTSSSAPVCSLACSCAATLAGADRLVGAGLRSAAVLDFTGVCVVLATRRLLFLRCAILSQPREERYRVGWANRLPKRYHFAVVCRRYAHRTNQEDAVGNDHGRALRHR